MNNADLLKVSPLKLFKILMIRNTVAVLINAGLILEGAFVIN